MQLFWHIYLLLSSQSSAFKYFPLETAFVFPANRDWKLTWQSTAPTMLSLPFGYRWRDLFTYRANSSIQLIFHGYKLPCILLGERADIGTGQWNALQLLKHEKYSKREGVIIKAWAGGGCLRTWKQT